MREGKPQELYRVLIEKGYPEEFCAQIACTYMNTDYTASRMLAYLHRAGHPRMEDIADEVLAVLSDREQWIRKKEMEKAQAVINDVYQNGL